MKHANKSYIKTLNLILKEEFPNAYLLKFYNHGGMQLTYWTPEKDVEYNVEGFVDRKLYNALNKRYDLWESKCVKPNGTMGL
jgi:hypothetical protein